MSAQFSGHEDGRADECLNSARMFMRSLVSDDARVGLLLFDEPSASLDPAAEHGGWSYLGLSEGRGTNF